MTGPDEWWEEHGSEVPDEIEDEIGNGTCVSTEEVVDTDDEPSYTIDDDSETDDCETDDSYEDDSCSDDISCSDD